MLAGCSSGTSSPASSPDVATSGQGFRTFDSYQLTYTSTCGGGPFITEGTTISVVGKTVTVVAGEEPREVRFDPIQAWNSLVADTPAGVLVEVTVSEAVTHAHSSSVTPTHSTINSVSTSQSLNPPLRSRVHASDPNVGDPVR